MIYSCVSPSPRTNRHHPLPRLHRPPHPALHPSQTEADHPPRGAETGHHPPGRYRPDRCPHRSALPAPTRTRVWSGLGEVPEHWEVRKLRHCGTVSGGMTPSMEVRRFWGGPVPWVTPKDMKRAVISDSSVRVTDSALQETPLRLIEPPAVLIVVRGMILARRVPIAYTAAPVTINQDMKAFRTLKGTGAVFLARLLDSAQEAFMPLIDEAGHGTRRLPTERWREIVIAVPPVEETGQHCGVPRQQNCRY